MGIKKGFITIATGKEEYYQLAANLLCSYHYFCKKPLPFAILTDKNNRYTEKFDDVLILSSEANNSYLDKLELGKYLPYDINIFIDSDCLAYGDLNQLFTYFSNADDFSCFGKELPLGDKSGWFDYENLGDLKSKVTYCISLHGGIYYMRKGKTCQNVFQLAKSLIKDYSKFKFKGNFGTPGDEPLVALSMAINNCKPIPYNLKAISCYWEYVNKVKLDIEKGQALISKEPSCNTILLHWGTRYTKTLLYQKQVEILKLLESNERKNKWLIKACKAKFNLLIIVEKCTNKLISARNRILRYITRGKV